MALWKQGYLLNNVHTRRMAKPLREISEQQEKREVYENFTEEDQGRSRRKVCACVSPDIAAQIAYEHNAHQALVALAIEIRDHLHEKQDYARVREMALNALPDLERT